MANINDFIDSSEFSMFSEEELRNMKYLDEIELLINKYALSQNDYSLIDSSEKNNLYVINYINLLKKDSLIVPEDIQVLFSTNYPFIEYANKFLKKKLKNLTKNDSTYFFDDVNLVLNILSAQTQYKIFNSYNSYNFEDISGLFRFYEQKLQHLFLEDKELYELTFSSYFILLELYTQLCIINSTDIIAKNNIKELTELMTESINMLKFSIQLDTKKLNRLNNLQGEHLYMFSHIYDIGVKEDDLEHSFKEYFHYLQRIEDGYFLSQKSNFSDDIKDDSQEFVLFKNNSSILILKLLKELDLSNIKEEVYFQNSFFKKFIQFYYDQFSYDVEAKSQLKNVEDFRQILLDSLLYNYNMNLEYTKIISHKTIIDDFIISDYKFDSKNLETVYRILAYAKDIEDFKYLTIGDILANTKAIKNDYHEYFKLKIFDEIIINLIGKKDNQEIEALFEKIFHYISINKNSSRILSMYSKIYLSLSLFYAKQDKIKKAMAIYTAFERIEGNNELKDIYSYTIQGILNKINTQKKSPTLVSKDKGKNDLVNNILGED